MPGTVLLPTEAPGLKMKCTPRLILLGALIIVLLWIAISNKRLTALVYNASKIANSSDNAIRAFVVSSAAEKTMCVAWGVHKHMNATTASNDVLYHVTAARRSVRYGLYLYRGYYDDRVFPSVVRVSGMISQRQLGYLGGFYCYLWLQNVSLPIVVRAEGRTIWKYYGAFQAVQFSCHIPTEQRDAVPSHVTLADSVCQEPSHRVPVRVPVRVPQRALGALPDFGVCLKVLYGAPDPVRLLEWIEVNLALGAGSIYVYNASITGKANDVLRYYAQKNLVFLQDHQFPEKLSREELGEGFPTTDYNQNWELELLSMTDCIYTGREKYLVNIDIDEVLFATNYTDLTRYLRHRETTHAPVTSLVFHTAVYSDELTPAHPSPDHVPAYMHMLRQNVRTRIDWESPKSVVLRSSCLALGHHICQRPLSNANVRADENEAVGHVRHYRHKCRLTGERGKCAKLLSAPVKDDSLFFLKEKLNETMIPLMRRYNLLES